MNNEKEFKLRIDTGPNVMSGITEAVSKDIVGSVW
jgi:hypothetical protein